MCGTLIKVKTRSFSAAKRFNAAAAAGVALPADVRLRGSIRRVDDYCLGDF